MKIYKTLILFGSPSAKQLSLNYLENMPQVKRIDMSQDGKISLLLLRTVREDEWIALFKQSGIQGFCFI